MAKKLVENNDKHGAIPIRLTKLSLYLENRNLAYERKHALKKKQKIRKRTSGN